MDKVGIIDVDELVAVAGPAVAEPAVAGYAVAGSAVAESGLAESAVAVFVVDAAEILAAAVAAEFADADIDMHHYSTGRRRGLHIGTAAVPSSSSS